MAPTPSQQTDINIIPLQRIAEAKAYCGGGVSSLPNPRVSQVVRNDGGGWESGTRILKELLSSLASLKHTRNLICSYLEPPSGWCPRMTVTQVTELGVSQGQHPRGLTSGDRCHSAPGGDRHLLKRVMHGVGGVATESRAGNHSHNTNETTFALEKCTPSEGSVIWRNNS